MVSSVVSLASETRGYLAGRGHLVACCDDRFELLT
jgi:hypothetical protein